MSHRVIIGYVCVPKQHTCCPYCLLVQSCFSPLFALFFYAFSSPSPSPSHSFHLTTTKQQTTTYSPYTTAHSLPSLPPYKVFFFFSVFLKNHLFAFIFFSFFLIHFFLSSSEHLHFSYLDLILILTLLTLLTLSLFVGVVTFTLPPCPVS